MDWGTPSQRNSEAGLARAGFLEEVVLGGVLRAEDISYLREWIQEQMKGSWGGKGGRVRSQGRSFRLGTGRMV